MYEKNFYVIKVIKNLFIYHQNSFLAMPIGVAEIKFDAENFRKIVNFTEKLSYKGPSLFFFLLIRYQMPSLGVCIFLALSPKKRATSTSRRDESKRRVMTSKRVRLVRVQALLPAFPKGLKVLSFFKNYSRPE